MSVSDVFPDPSSRTLAVSDPQVVDLSLVAVGDGASEDQRVVGQSESVAAAGVSDGRKTSGCRRKNDGDECDWSLVLDCINASLRL